EERHYRGAVRFFPELDLHLAYSIHAHLALLAAGSKDVNGRLQQQAVEFRAVCRLLGGERKQTLEPVLRGFVHDASSTGRPQPGPPGRRGQSRGAPENHSGTIPSKLLSVPWLSGRSRAPHRMLRLASSCAANHG